MAQSHKLNMHVELKNIDIEFWLLYIWEPVLPLENVSCVWLYQIEGGTLPLPTATTPDVLRSFIHNKRKTIWSIIYWIKDKSIHMGGPLCVYVCMQYRGRFEDSGSVEGWERRRALCVLTRAQNAGGDRRAMARRRCDGRCLGPPTTTTHTYQYIYRRRWMEGRKKKKIPLEGERGRGSLHLVYNNIPKGQYKSVV